jgi:glycogen debranching enzyme
MPNTTAAPPIPGGGGDVIEVGDQFYILAKASRAAQRTAVLQHDDTFAVFDYSGDIGAYDIGEEGLYYEGTRYLSRFSLRVNGKRPLILSSRVKEDNELFVADLTNPDIPIGNTGQIIRRDLVHLFRSRFLWNGTWYERVRFWNYSRAAVLASLSFEFDADFADIFEVRGTPRAKRGQRLATVHEGTETRLGYRGLDGETRWAVIDWGEAPHACTPTGVQFAYDLEPSAPISLAISIRCDREQRRARRQTFEAAQTEWTDTLEAERAEYASVETSSERFNQWVRRSAADLRMLVAKTKYGPYPYAGVPWFSTPFGRDGVITGLQTLWINPGIARGVLKFLAATQADKVSDAQDEQPGKIIHEMRNSEMARLGEVPFGRYYGSVDSTPLFVILAGAFIDRTGDRKFLERIWPNVERALDWIDNYGDCDGDGFVEYARQSPTGLVQQGWKDSSDSIFHADGTLATAPVALCEVQAYVYDARLRAARMAEMLGHGDRAKKLRVQAEELRCAFEEHFWCEEIGTYALALDGHKEPCRVRSSNAGHALFGGIAERGRARRVAEQLLGGEMFSGWGIRTIAIEESRFNPMAYHNGSVWPHDNGLATTGFSRYGFDDLVTAPFSSMFEASVAVENHRLPELFCGFQRRTGEGPVLYPVACSPQAWSSGVVFQMLQACMRLSVDATEHRLSIERASLPPFLTYLRLMNLSLPFGSIDLLFEQHLLDVSVTVLRKQGDFEVRVIK